MNVPQLLDEVHRHVPKDAPFGTRWKAACVVTLEDGVPRVAAAARIDPQGRRREQFWCDDVRVERAVLLRLTCTERKCPHATQVRAQWAAFHGRDRAVSRTGPPLTIEQLGFVLFEGSVCLGGGVTEFQGVRRPRIPSVRAAQAYVLAWHLETMAVLGAARDASRGEPRPAADAD